MATQQPQDSEPTTNSSLVSRLSSIDERLASFEAAQSSLSADYEKSNSKYLKELEEFGRSRVISLVLRVVSLGVLIYIAYRVS